MSHYVSEYVVCPYYHRHDENRICCEGTNSKNTINLVFGDRTKLRDHVVTYCNSMAGHKRCMICRALNEKHGV